MTREQANALDDATAKLTAWKTLAKGDEKLEDELWNEYQHSLIYLHQAMRTTT